MMSESRPALSIAQWLSERRRLSGLTVEQVPFAECSDWSFSEGILRHRTGRFFSVVGLHCTAGPRHLQGLTLPMIHQPEIGILGFVVRQGDAGWQWLLQSKTEPGNVGGTQVGPTVQATVSNYLRVHGGQPTQMLELFTEGRHALRQVADVEQSEQGDRFLGKYNRNTVVEVGPSFQAPAEDHWRWFGAREVREALACDFAFNTDARSVLCCADWSLLSDPDEPHPFARWHTQGGFGEQLLRSFQVPLQASGHGAALRKLHAARAASTLQVARRRLDDMAGWRCDAWSIECEKPGIDPVVRAFHVHSADREVTQWHQPLLTNRYEGRAVLACTQRDGVMQFLLALSAEPGFSEHVQFGPSFLTGLGHANPAALGAAIDRTDATSHAAVSQSDEGGRFKDSTARYQIIELPRQSAEEFESMGAWVSLSALQAMAKERGLLSNELRSCISLLLSWA